MYRRTSSCRDRHCDLGSASYWEISPPGAAGEGFDSPVCGTAGLRETDYAGCHWQRVRSSVISKAIGRPKPRPAAPGVAPWYILICNFLTRCWWESTKAVIQITCLYMLTTCKWRRFSQRDCENSRKDYECSWRDFDHSRKDHEKSSKDYGNFLQDCQQCRKDCDSSWKDCNSGL